MKKTVIDRQIIIAAPKQKVWDTLADFGNVMNLSPNITKSYLTSEQKNGLGATRHCDFLAMGAEVDEKISQWDEGHSLTIDLFNPKNLPMMKGMQAHFEVSEEKGQTRLKGKFEYGISNPIGKFLNKIKMRSMNIKSWEQFMAGIKHNVESGEKVDKKTKLNLSSVMA